MLVLVRALLLMPAWVQIGSRGMHVMMYVCMYPFFFLSVTQILIITEAGLNLSLSQILGTQQGSSM